MHVEKIQSCHDEEVVQFLRDVGEDNYSVLTYHFPMFREMLELMGVGEPLYL